MNLKNLFNKVFGPRFRLALAGLGIALFLFGLAGSNSVLAAMAATVDWGDISPDMLPNPEFVENTNVPVEIDTYFAPGGSPHLNPYHGLSSSTGGVSGFNSQTFTNISDSGVDVTVYYSENNWDGNNLEGPDLYKPGDITTINPDQRVTGEYALRITRDSVGTRTPTTVVLSFSEAVYMSEFIVGSLSNVSGSYEHALIRAFATADATGPVVKASDLINISNLSDCSTLWLSQCVASGPTPTNALTNIAVDPDLTDAGNDGTYDNVGTGDDDGIYHVYGIINQPDGYGRVKVVYETALIRSIAFSFFPTATASFTDIAYTDQWISTILAPFTITPQDPTVITLSQASTSEPNTSLLLIGLALIIMATITGLAFRPRRQSVE